jgi:hypothetical protein
MSEMKLYSADEAIAKMDAIIKPGRKKAWLTIGELPEIDWDGPALATVHSGHGLTIIRRRGSEYVVVLVDGRRNKVVKALPTLDAARAYQFAMHRN